MLSDFEDATQLSCDFGSMDGNACSFLPFFRSDALASRREREDDLPETDLDVCHDEDCFLASVGVGRAPRISISSLWSEAGGPRILLVMPSDTSPNPCPHAGLVSVSQMFSTDAREPPASFIQPVELAGVGSASAVVDAASMHPDSLFADAINQLRPLLLPWVGRAKRRYSSKQAEHWSSYVSRWLQSPLHKITVKTNACMRNRARNT